MADQELAPQLMLSRPGIQRDGTRLSQTQYTDGRWCRFYQDTPIKMNGYREQLRGVGGIVRALDVQSYDGYTYVHIGMQDSLQRYAIDYDTGQATGLTDRTPTGFVGDPFNNWQFSLVFDTANDANLLLTHAAPNIHDIASTAERPVYYSEVRAAGPFLPIVGSEVSGGVVAMWPYFLRFGNDGEVAWPVAGNLTNLTGTGSGSARPWGTKIVKGLPIRGTSKPAVLLWALDALIRVQLVGGAEVMDFTTLTTSSAILSSNGVIEHAGIYYWATVSGFTAFNGVVTDMDNETNRQWFLNNLNWKFRQKVFAMKIPRWHEIWWCFPYGDASECTHAVIYDYVKRRWYDTELIAPGMSAGVYEQIYNYPIVASWRADPDDGNRSMWQFDVGLDEISGVPAVSKAIPAWFETHEFNLLENDGALGRNGIDRAMSYQLMEADFDQIGDLELYLRSRMNARAPIKTKGPFPVPAAPGPNEQITKFKHTGRLTSFKVVSNQLGGFFHAGAPLIHWMPSDGRRET